MPIRTVFEGKIENIQILDENGNFDEKLGKGLLSDAEVKSLYELMIVSREFDDVAFKLQRSGRLGTFPQNRGQEAAALGAAKALKRGHDWIVPYYRENPGAFLHGLPMHYIYLHWMGDERGNQIPVDKGITMTPLSIAIGTQTLHAAGMAWAFKIRKEPKVVTCFMGDGATSTGDWHEGMNFGAVMQLPCIYYVINNNFAISVPCCNQTHTQTFAQKAFAYGMPGVQVDGNDIFAVYKAHKEAVERARSGGGPTLIEAVTYRLADHTTADDARRYRDAKEYELALKRDPLVRTRKFLEARSLWNDDLQKQQESKAKTLVQEVAQIAMNIEPPKVTDMFDYVFEKLPAELAKQRETMRTESLGQDPDQVGLQPAWRERLAHAE
jgi:pyruvate dehydrogenase E1 component alpha subunit